jgi:hypothetical protein
MKINLHHMQKPSSLLRLHFICSAVAVVPGLVISYVDRYGMWPDGINYLDMGDAYLRGDWEMALNGLWSPLYSWLLGLAMVLIKPSITQEFPVVHMVNFLIYLMALASFQYFLLELHRYYRSRIDTLPEGDSLLSHESILIVLSYSFFIWSSIKYINFWIVTPDMLISVYIYLISATLIRFHMGLARTRSFVILGFIFGLSYLTKAIMLPMALVFLGVGFIVAGHDLKALRNTVIAFSVLVLIGSPFVVALSQAKGYFTLGDSGKLNYAWHVNGIQKWIHWQGDPQDGNMPEHPTRIIFPSPTIYEFDGPVGGTYPPDYDPSYWYEGVKIHFDLHQQIVVFIKNIKIFLVRFVILQSGIIICLLLMICYSRNKYSIMKRLVELWFLIFPPFVALFLYLLVHVEQRYLGGYNVIVLCSLLLGILLAYNNRWTPVLKIVCAFLLIIVTFQICTYTVYIASNRSPQFDWLDIANRQANDKDRDFFSSTPSEMADHLRRGIIAPGDKIACIERLSGMHAFWARLAKARIVAEIQGEDVEKFWSADDLVKARVIEAFARTGAKILVFNPPDYVTELAAIDARRIDNTRYYYIPLER